MDNKKEYFNCPICNRMHESQKMTWHHLKPSVDGEEKIEEERIYICKTCHPVIHYCLTNFDLRNYYNTADRILQSPDIQDMLELYQHKTYNVVISIKKLLKLKSDRLINKKKIS